MTTEAKPKYGFGKVLKAEDRILFRHMIVEFEDGSTKRYMTKLGDMTGKTTEYIKAYRETLEHAAKDRFRAMRNKGRNYGDPFTDRRVCRDPGPKATKIVAVWDGDDKGIPDRLATARAELLMSKV